MVQIPAQWAQEANNLLTLAGLPQKGVAFEKHFCTNKKILTIYEELLLETSNIEYYDHEDGDFRVGEIFVPKRRFSWQQRYVHLPKQLSLVDIIDDLAYDGMSDGYPIGIVLENTNYARIHQVASLGQVIEKDYCTCAKIDEFRYLHLYLVQKVPSLNVLKIH